MTNEVMLKLVSGEEIFASILGVDEEKIVIAFPMKIFKQYVDTERGMSIQLNYEPFLDYTNASSIPIKHEHIMLCEPLLPRLVGLYNDMKNSTRPMTDDTPKQEAPIISGNITLH